MSDLLNQSFSVQQDRLKTVEIARKKEDSMNYSDYIKTYEDLARQVGGMVLANEITSRPLELINGDLDDEIYQFYIIQDPNFLIEHTDEIVFHDDLLDLCARTKKEQACLPRHHLLSFSLTTSQKPF